MCTEYIQSVYRYILALHIYKYIQCVRRSGVDVTAMALVEGDLGKGDCGIGDRGRAGGGMHGIIGELLRVESPRRYVEVYA